MSTRISVVQCAPGSGRSDIREKMTASHLYIESQGPGPLLFRIRGFDSLDEIGGALIHGDRQNDTRQHVVQPGVKYLLANHRRKLNSYRFVAVEYQASQAASFKWAPDVVIQKDADYVELTPDDLPHAPSFVSPLLAVGLSHSRGVAPAHEMISPGFYMRSSRNGAMQNDMERKQAGEAVATQKQVQRPSQQHAESSGEIVAEFARKQIGNRYRNGGTGPLEYDAVGLIYQAHRRAGIDVPRDVWDLVQGGMKIRLDNPEIGDTLFFCTCGRGCPCHPAIYAGQRRFLHVDEQVETIAEQEITADWMERLRAIKRFWS